MGFSASFTVSSSLDFRAILSSTLKSSRWDSSKALFLPLFSTVLFTAVSNVQVSAVSSPPFRNSPPSLSIPYHTYPKPTNLGSKTPPAPRLTFQIPHSPRCCSPIARILALPRTPSDPKSLLQKNRSPEIIKITAAVLISRVYSHHLAHEQQR